MLERFKARSTDVPVPCIIGEGGVLDTTPQSRSQDRPATDLGGDCRGGPAPARAHLLAPQRGGTWFGTMSQSTSRMCPPLKMLRTSLTLSR